MQTEEEKNIITNKYDTQIYCVRLFNGKCSKIILRETIMWRFR